MNKLSLLATVLLLLTACGITEENLSTKYARAVCHQEKRCQQGDFERQWSDMGDCIDEVDGFFEDVQDYFALLECELDEKSARRYLHDLRGASCEEYVSGDYGDDAEIFDCPF